MSDKLYQWEQPGLFRQTARDKTGNDKKAARDNGRLEKLPCPPPPLLEWNHEAVFSRRDHRGRQISYLLSCCTQIAKLASPEDAVSPERARCRARGKCARTSGAPRLITGKIFFFLVSCVACCVSDCAGVIFFLHTFRPHCGRSHIGSKTKAICVM